MTDTSQLTETRMREGVWEGVLAQPAKPDVRVTHREAELHDVTVTAEGEGLWRVRVGVPVETLSDGVQTYLIADTETDAKLASFSIAAGDVLSEDLRAEVDLLRSELDMLKRAFRRHCVETEA
ncbi:MAG: hypothetical protein AAGH73_00525 [Pseudomonadota bacterium]